MFVGTDSNCIGDLEFHLRNYCEDILIHDKKEMYNYNKYIQKDFISSDTKSFVKLKIGDHFIEEVYYKNNPNKKIILNFVVKK